MMLSKVCQLIWHLTGDGVNHDRKYWGWKGKNFHDKKNMPMGKRVNSKMSAALYIIFNRLK